MISSTFRILAVTGMSLDDLIHFGDFSCHRYTNASQLWSTYKLALEERWGEADRKTGFISFADIWAVNTPSLAYFKPSRWMELGRNVQTWLSEPTEHSLLWHTSAPQPTSSARHHAWASVSHIKPSLPGLGFSQFWLVSQIKLEQQVASPTSHSWNSLYLFWFCQET